MDLLEIINKKFNDKVEVKEDAFQPTVYVEKDNLIEVIETLKEDGEFSFKLLADLTAVDYEEYFEVVYHLMSFKTSEMLRIKVKLDRNNPEIPSLSNIWKAAIDQERETYDLLGINFTNHPNLTRILCPEDFEGHPLRKDFQQ